MTKYREVEIDLYDFSNEELIDEIKDRVLTKDDITILKAYIEDSDIDYSEIVLKENELYQKILKIDTMDNQMKMEIILDNLDKLSYNNIYDIFKR